MRLVKHSIIILGGCVLGLLYWACSVEATNHNDSMEGDGDSDLEEPCTEGVCFTTPQSLHREPRSNRPKHNLHIASSTLADKRLAVWRDSSNSHAGFINFAQAGPDNIWQSFFDGNNPEDHAEVSLYPVYIRLEDNISLVPIIDKDSNAHVFAMISGHQASLPGDFIRNLAYWKVPWDPENQCWLPPGPPILLNTDIPGYEEGLKGPFYFSADVGDDGSHISIIWPVSTGSETTLSNEYHLVLSMLDSSTDEGWSTVILPFPWFLYESGDFHFDGQAFHIFWIARYSKYQDRLVYATYNPTTQEFTIEEPYLTPEGTYFGAIKLMDAGSAFKLLFSLYGDTEGLFITEFDPSLPFSLGESIYNNPALYQLEFTVDQTSGLAVVFTRNEAEEFVLLQETGPGWEKTVYPTDSDLLDEDDSAYLWTPQGGGYGMSIIQRTNHERYFEMFNAVKLDASSPFMSEDAYIQSDMADINASDIAFVETQEGAPFLYWFDSFPWSFLGKTIYPPEISTDVEHFFVPDDESEEMLNRVWHWGFSIGYHPGSCVPYVNLDGLHVSCMQDGSRPATSWSDPETPVLLRDDPLLIDDLGQYIVFLELSTDTFIVRLSETRGYALFAGMDIPTVLIPYEGDLADPNNVQFFAPQSMPNIPYLQGISGTVVGDNAVLFVAYSSYIPPAYFYASWGEQPQYNWLPTDELIEEDDAYITPLSFIQGTGKDDIFLLGSRNLYTEDGESSTLWKVRFDPQARQFTQAEQVYEWHDENALLINIREAVGRQTQDNGFEYLVKFRTTLDSGDVEKIIYYAPRDGEPFIIDGWAADSSSRGMMLLPTDGGQIGMVYNKVTERGREYFYCFGMR